MKILVTGSAGFIGSHLVDALIDLGHDVYGVDNLSGGHKKNINPKSKFTKLELCDKKSTAIYVGKVRPQILFHLAADATEGRSQFTPINSTENNYLAYLNVLVPSIKSGLKKVILTSSMSVYGAQKTPFSEDMPTQPEDIYGVSKAAMEQATKILSNVHGFKYVIIRPHNVYGPRQNMQDPYRNVIGIFINCLLNNKRFYIYGDGDQKRAFTYIDDFIPFFVKSGFTKKAEGEIINIGPTDHHSINQLAEIILKVTLNGKGVPKHLQPKHLPSRPLEIEEAWCTAKKAQKILGFKASTPLDEGINKMFIWAKQEGAKKFEYKDLEIVNRFTPKPWKNHTL